jgi:hypothetical protein
MLARSCCLRRSLLLCHVQVQVVLLLLLLLLLLVLLVPHVRVRVCWQCSQDWLHGIVLLMHAGLLMRCSCSCGPRQTSLPTLLLPAVVRGCCGRMHGGCCCGTQHGLIGCEWGGCHLLLLLLLLLLQARHGDDRRAVHGGCQETQQRLLRHLVAWCCC